MNTPDTEWENRVRAEWDLWDNGRFGHLEGAIQIIEELLTSRDTYWKEMLQKEVEKALTVVKLRIVYDRRQGTPAEETVQDIYDSIELKLTPITNEDNK